MAWSSSWKVSAAVGVVLLGQSSLGQSRCAPSTLTIKSYGDAALATECATVIDGVSTLQHSLHFISLGEKMTLLPCDFGDVQVVIGNLLLLLSTPPSTLSDLVLSGTKLENITGDIKAFGDLALSGRRGILDFPALRSLSSFEVDSLGDHSPVDVRSTSHAMSSVRITGTRDFNLEFLSSVTQPRDFYFLRNTLARHDNGSAMGNLIVRLRQVSGHLEFSGNPDLAMLSIPHLESAGAMTVSNNTGLEVFDSSIIKLRSISVNANPTARLNLPELQSLGGSSLFSNLAFLDLASLHNTTEPGTDLSFSNNTFTDLHLPALDALATGLSIKDNPLLDDVHLTGLRRVDGSLAVRGNPRLLTFSANHLLVVKGSVRLAGPFTNVEMFRLEEVAGDFDLAGDPSMDCSWFDENVRAKVVKGSYSCTGNHTAPAVARRPSADGETPNVPQDEGLSTGAKAGIGVGAAVGGGLAIGFSVWALLAWKRKRIVACLPTGAEIGKPEVDGTGRADLPGLVVSEPVAHQLDTRPRPRTPELGDTGVLVELQ